MEIDGARGSGWRTDLFDVNGMHTLEGIKHSVQRSTPRDRF